MNVLTRRFELISGIRVLAQIQVMPTGFPQGVPDGLGSFGQTRGEKLFTTCSRMERQEPSRSDIHPKVGPEFRRTFAEERHEATRITMVVL